MGEASHPGPPFPLSSGDRVDLSPPNQEFLDLFEHDLSTSSRSRRRVRRRVQDSDSDDAPLMQVDLHPGSDGRRVHRRLVLVPQDSQGTPRSVQDREPPPSTVQVSVPSTIPASSGTVRRLVLVQSQQMEPNSGSTTVPASIPFQNRFEALRELDQVADQEGDAIEEVDERHSDLMSEEDGRSVSGEDDSDSIVGASEADQEAVVHDPTPGEAPVEFIPRDTQNVAAFASLDLVDMREVFSCRASVMQTIPHFLRGAFRGAVRVALKAVLHGYEIHSDARITQGWKLLMLLPRMLLHRPPRGGVLSRKKFEERFQCFHEGRWTQLLAESMVNAQKTHQASIRRRRRQRDHGRLRQFDRALRLVHLGELSAARQALESAEVAPGTLATLRELTNPVRRPPVPRQGLSEDLRHFEPREPFQLDAGEFLVCLRTARRGASAGPSGMTADHLFPVLESDRDSALLVQVASKLARGDVPEEVIDSIRLGRLTALNKPDGGVRGIVVGDIFRRLVAKTMAKQMAKKAEKATAPFQYALSTKAGWECIAHILQALTDLDANTTVVTIDGVGAYDLISRNAMMEGILKMEDGDRILPFVRCFYGSPSTYLWEDEMGVSQEIPQGEGGEQGDPLIPCCSR